LARDRRAVGGAVRRPGAGPQEPQIIIDLRDRADRRTRVTAGGLLLDRDGGRKPLDGIDVRLLHEAEELSRVGRERLDVATLSLSVDGVERQRGLTRSREPRDDGQRVAGDLDGDVLEVVLAGAADDQRI